MLIIGTGHTHRFYPVKHFGTLTECILTFGGSDLAGSGAKRFDKEARITNSRGVSSSKPVPESLKNSRVYSLRGISYQLRTGFHAAVLGVGMAAVLFSSSLLDIIASPTPLVPLSLERPYPVEGILFLSLARVPVPTMALSMAEQRSGREDWQWPRGVCLPHGQRAMRIISLRTYTRRVITSSQGTKNKNDTR